MSTDAERSFELLMFSDAERAAFDRERAAAERERLADLECHAAERGEDIFGRPLPRPARGQS